MEAGCRRDTAKNNIWQARRQRTILPAEEEKVSKRFPRTRPVFIPSSNYVPYQSSLVGKNETEMHKLRMHTQ